MTTNNNELYHYGVPGMKWGQRRATSKVDKVSSRAKKRGWSDDATDVAKIKTKKIKQMSNDELKKVKKRGDLERDYKNLNPNAIKKGLMIAGATAAALGTIATLAKHGKTIVNAGKNTVQKFKNSRVDASTKAFRKGMSNVANLKVDYSSLLK